MSLNLAGIVCYYFAKALLLNCGHPEFRIFFLQGLLQALILICSKHNSTSVIMQAFLACAVQLDHTGATSLSRDVVAICTWQQLQACLNIPLEVLDESSARD